MLGSGRDVTLAVDIPEYDLKEGTMVLLGEHIFSDDIKGWSITFKQNGAERKGWVKAHEIKEAVV